MTLKEAIINKNVNEIRKIVSSIPIAEVVDVFEDLSLQEKALFFRLLNSDLQSELFTALDPDYQEELIRTFSDQQIKEIVDDLYADEIADLVEDMPSDIASKVLKYASKETREFVNKILKYSDDQVGSVMTVDIVNINIDWKVEKAVKAIKARKDDTYIGHYLFAVDNNNKLLGSIATEDLLFASDETIVRELIHPVASVLITSNKEDAANTFADNDMSVLPVVDHNSIVMGVITSDDMIDVVQEAATEDFQKMAGIAYDEDVPYSRTKTWVMFRSRIIWLMLLMLSATISQIVLDTFQGLASKHLDTSTISSSSSAIWTTAIVAILPVISGAAGNAGSQSSTMVIRSLAVGDITTKDYAKVIWKELKVSTLIGLALAVANFARLMVYYGASSDLSSHDATKYIFLSLAASIALFAVIVLAKVTGGTLPLLAKKLKLDPAVMAAPLLTTLIDALSTMIFFGISIGIMILALN